VKDAILAKSDSVLIALRLNVDVTCPTFEGVDKNVVDDLDGVGKFLSGHLSAVCLASLADDDAEPLCGSKVRLGMVVEAHDRPISILMLANVENRNTHGKFVVECVVARERADVESLSRKRAGEPPLGVNELRL
jgi:hypothetical protein